MSAAQEAVAPSAGPIVAYVQGQLQFLDQDACALIEIVNRAKKKLVKHDQAILAAALKSICRTLNTNIGDLQDEISQMVRDPDFNPAASKGDAA